MTVTRAHGAENLLPPELARRLVGLALGSRGRRAGRLRGDRRSTKRGTSLEFADYRDYSPGDDLRRVDWNLYARTDRLSLKLYEEEEDRAVHLLLDTSASMGFGDPSKLATALRLAAALGYVALGELDRLHLAALGPDGLAALRPLRGPGGVRPLLGFLGGLRADGGASLGRALGEYAGRTRQAGLVVLLSDLLDPDGLQAGLRALGSRGHELVVLQVLSRDELEPPAHGDVELVDAESRERRPMTVDAAALESYARALDAWFGEVRRACASVDAAYALVEAETPVDETLFGALRRSRVLVSR